MTVDPDIAAALADPRSGRGRFAQQERATMARTNGWRVRGRGPLHDLGWPRFFGTSPWGALAELEQGTGRRYRVVLVRGRGAADRGRAFDEVLAAVGTGAPALLYVGDRLLPRHVTLLVPGDPVLLYEPARGVAMRPDRDAFVSTSLALAGWHVPWFALAPLARRTGSRPPVSDGQTRRSEAPDRRGTRYSGREAPDCCGTQDTGGVRCGVRTPPGRFGVCLLRGRRRREDPGSPPAWLRGP